MSADRAFEVVAVALLRHPVATTWRLVTEAARLATRSMALFPQREDGSW